MLKSGAFCDAPADQRFPNRICASHDIKVFLAARDQIPDCQVMSRASPTVDQ
ncbi:hypothetical protein [Aeromicrobium sp. 50.2.37]|uniref:hypothetical protein n=1 Tax=Aeromicrobium sp. 50.2.37 TaxID=2969305 RepID=UPI00214FA412|nr:hypothetical protein [Aeromicrobium sp. 50.2.37]MCR4514578.1 hypothetical protein [Aeromicrobium sp. 50.2.37]